MSSTSPSALPGLVCAGVRDDGAVLLLDLESYDGVVSLGGDPGVARGVAMSLAVETATHPWADAPVVTLVGFADDVAGIGNVRAVSDIGRALEALDNVERSLARGRVAGFAGGSAVTRSPWLIQTSSFGGLPAWSFRPSSIPHSATTSTSA